jgi:GNAT superfamily N-acetyltransferase
MRYELRKAGRGLFIRSLTTSELPKYLEHLLRLNSTDRRMRFGFAIGDTGIREHVQRIDLRTDYILALFDDDLDVVAAAHMAWGRDDNVAEFAFSVDREWRSCGVGRELFNRTVLWARNRGIRQAILYCLYENQAIRQLARQAGVQMTVDAGEIEGRLDLLPATR